MNPLVHFLTAGAREGRDPNPWFDTSFYVDADPRLRESGENPLVHYLRVGAAKGGRRAVRSTRLTFRPIPMWLRAA